MALILVDMTLPRMNGLELIAETKKNKDLTETGACPVAKGEPAIGVSDPVA